MYDFALKLVTGAWYFGRVLLLVVLFFLGFILIFVLVSGPRQPTYVEANPVEYSIWSRIASSDIPFNASYGEDLAIVCVYPNGEVSLETMLDWDSIKFSGVLRGSMEHTEQEEFGGLYRVVFVDMAGQAEVWKFDERRFTVAFGDENRLRLDTTDNGSAFGCVNASSIMYSVEQLPDGRYGLSITGGQSSEGDE
jgi:hypothetical protein